MDEGGLIAFNIGSADKSQLKKTEAQLKAGLDSVKFVADLVEEQSQVIFAARGIIE